MPLKPAIKNKPIHFKAAVSCGADDETVRGKVRLLMTTVSDYKSAASHAKKMKPKQSKPSGKAAPAPVQ